MRKIFTILLLGLCSLSLVGCDNMSKQDVGVLTGGLAGGLLGSTVGGGSGRVMAIAAGTVAGAFIGSKIGKSMDEVDRMKMDHALENNSIGEPTYWHNENTGADYRVVPTKNVSVEGNEYCREYRTIAYIGHKKQEVYGTACRQPDGSWQIVNS